MGVATSFSNIVVLGKGHIGKRVKIAYCDKTCLIKAIIFWQVCDKNIPCADSGAWDIFMKWNN